MTDDSGNGRSAVDCNECAAMVAVNEVRLRQQLQTRDGGILLAEVRSLREYVQSQMLHLSSEMARLIGIVHELSELVRGGGA